MALTLRVGVPPTSEVAHHLAAGQVTVKVLERVQKELNLWSQRASVGAPLVVTHHQQQDVAGHGDVERLEPVDG